MARDAGHGTDGAARKRGFGRLINDFLTLSAGQLLSKVLGFIAFAFLARALSVAEYGAVETAVGMAAIGVVAIELGTGSIGVRRMSERGADRVSVLGAVFSARILLALLVTPLLGVAYAALSPTSDLVILLYAISLFAAAFNCNWFFQASERMGVAGFGPVLKTAVFIAALAALWFAGLRSAVIAGLAELIAAGVVSFWFAAMALRAVRPAWPSFSVGRGATMVREGAPLGASGLVNDAAQYLPIMIVGALSGIEEAAAFGVAQRLVISALTFSFVYYFNLFPTIARRMSDDAASLNTLMKSSAKMTAWAGASASLILWLFAAPIIALIFGEKYRAAGEEFGVLAWSIALTLGSGNSRWLLVAARKQGALLTAYLLYAGVMIGLVCLLAPRFGAMGACWAAVIASACLWGMTEWFARNLTAEHRLGSIGPAALASALACLPIFAFSWPLWAEAALALAAFVAVLAFDKGVRPAFAALAGAKDQK